MPFYQYLTNQLPDGERIIERLLELRKQLKANVPQRTLEDTLLLATWNIREFDGPKYGRRMAEAYYYIAEIISHFDLVAVQEVNKDLDALNQVIRILGSHWKYIFTDETAGRAGNMERLAMLYDSRKITFGGLASEVVIPPRTIRTPDGKTVIEPARQLARTPFAVGWKSGWTDFVLTTVHIYYGEAKAEDPLRVQEISEIAEFLAKQSKSVGSWSHNYILLGDFNIFDPEDATMKALKDAKFNVPEELQNLPSNVARNKYYDQIAFMVRNDRFETTGKAGVFDFYETVFRESDEQIYVPYMGEGYLTTSAGKPRTNPGNYYRDWRTHQMSDHLPMWVELQINFSDAYLQRKLKEKQDAASRGALWTFRDPLLP